jgi:hypothetical protein
MLDDVQINIPGGLEFALPRMARVRQVFQDHGLPDVTAAVTAELAKPGLGDTVKPGATIAVGVGSRGVANIGTAVKALVAGLKERGAEPFIFPAMGSHGGGTVEGQIGVLKGYGITEEAIGAPVRATMDTVIVDTMPDGTPIHMDRYAHEADGVVLINRVKPHTNFRGAIESGVTKMMIIGMGKIAGASAVHGTYPMPDFGEMLPALAKKLMTHIPFLFGIGMVEDAFDNTAVVEGLPADELFEREAVLQAKAKEFMARLYTQKIDVLIIDEIGKEISGSGFDPNVTGRNIPGIAGFDLPNVKKIVLFDVSDATKGNATGIGSADVITRRLFSRIDFPVTYANIVTSTYLEGARVPIAMKDEGDAVRLAVKTLNAVAPLDARIVRIHNTLELSEIMMSESMLEEIRGDDRFEILEEPAEMALQSAA